MTVNGPLRHTPTLRPGSQPDPTHGVCAICDKRLVWDNSIHDGTGKPRAWRHVKRRSRAKLVQIELPSISEQVPGLSTNDLLAAILDELKALRLCWEDAS